MSIDKTRDEDKINLINPLRSNFLWEIGHILFLKIWNRWI